MAVGRVNLISGDDSAVLRGRSLPREASELLTAAQAGSADAQTRYGQMLIDDGGPPRDAQAAVLWFWNAASQGQAMAMNMLGRCYESGIGVAIDKVRASEWYRSSADRGEDSAMYNLGILTALGEGVCQDSVGAIALFDKVVDLACNARAINHIAAFHEQGWIYDQSMIEAARLYAIAAGRGHSRSMFDHARMLLAAGRRSEALLWLEKAQDAGTELFGERIREWLKQRGLPTMLQATTQSSIRLL